MGTLQVKVLETTAGAEGPLPHSHSKLHTQTAVRGLFLLPLPWKWPICYLMVTVSPGRALMFQLQFSRAGY